MPRSSVSLLCLCAAALAPAVPLPARAQGIKRDDVPGYSFAHVTANSTDDSFPRVSRDGKVVWMGRYNLPGASSGPWDTEVMLWDAGTTTQITDDDVDQVRPVVNDAGNMAWQVGDGSDFTEIFADIDGVISQLTDDPQSHVIDRYPDINDAGYVVWGRLLGFDYYTCVWNAITQGPYSVIGPGYRPHISALNHIHAAGENGIFDTSYLFVQPMPPPSAFGYLNFRRSEINDTDQLALEAELGPVQHADMFGPRDILFWDGAQMHRLYRSPGPWHGRPDLNASGVIAWEGYGGLPGSRSGPNDEEIFVYRPELRQVVQLTDDDANDFWPTVSADGRVFWMGLGKYPNAAGADWDRDIFVATPNDDADQDTIPNAADNCALRANADQSDLGGIGGPTPDGVGDVCQCGDVSNDGAVDANDVAAFRDALAQGQIDSLPGAAKCRVNGAWENCSVLDVTVMRRALDPDGALAPGLEQACDAALQF